MIDTRLYEALVSEARCDAGLYHVYGRKLAPFSLRHSLQLEALDSPLFTGAEWEPFDLQVAAEICSRRELTPAPRKPGWWPRLRHDRAREEDRFYEYFSACYARPELFERPNSGGGGKLHAPLELIIVTYLLRKTTIGEERAWTMPAGLAMWLYESILEQETGDSNILTEALAAEMAAQTSAEEIAAGERLTRYFQSIEGRMQEGDPTAPAERAEFIRTGEPPPDFV
jgi:hypothetical protein